MIPIDNETILADDEQAPGIIDTLDKAKSDRLKNLMSRLVSRAQVATAIAAVNQARINKACQRLETRVVEGLGEWACRIDVGVFLTMRNLHGAKCWYDPEFVTAFLRDNPACALHRHAANYVHGWRPEEKIEAGKQESRNGALCAS